MEILWFFIGLTVGGSCGALIASVLYLSNDSKRTADEKIVTEEKEEKSKEESGV